MAGVGITLAVFAGLGGAGAMGVASKRRNSILRSELLAERNKKMIELRVEESRLDFVLQQKRRELHEMEIELRQKDAIIEIEEEKISKYKNINNDKTTKFIVAVGFTGHGKSTVLNRLNGDDSEDGDQGPFAVADSDQSGIKSMIILL